MTEPLYRIKPLVWMGPCVMNRDEWWSATTPFGNYRVERVDGQCRWSYCFIEHYDEGVEQCGSIEEGKSAAEADWRERIAECLENATAPTNERN